MTTKLFEPIVVRGMTIKNRIVMAPLSTNFPVRSEQSKIFYAERAEGGVGAITLGATNIDAFFSDRFIEGVREWVINPVHEYGVKIGPELWHGNLNPTLPAKGIMQEWVAPSAGSPLGGRVLSSVLRAPAECFCRELSISEIQEIIARFARAAARAKEAGFDYIDVHGAHGHNLPDQFFSPRDNRRNDIYGGSFAGRIRFSIELATAIRSTIGDNFPFFWRLSSEHGLPGDYTLDEAVEYASKLVEAGVDVIDVSYGHEIAYEAAPVRSISVCPGPEEPMGTFIPFAEVFKRRLSVPIIGVGGIRTIEVAEEALSRGKVDMIAVGRQLLADPYWVQKVASGRFDDIRPCICCNTCITTFRDEQAPIRCAVNASLGRDKEFQIKPAQSTKTVLVVGGGPAGMEAALVAAQRGHDVTLIERAKRLGGTLLLANETPSKPTINNLIRYLSNQVEKAGVKIKLNEEVSLESVEKMKPDVVVLATGASPCMPDVTGLSGNKKVVTAADVLSGQVEAGHRVVILGGGLVACDTAEFLASRGQKVTIVEVLPDIASEMHLFQRQFISYRLGGKGVVIITSVKDEKGTEEGLLVTDKWGRDYLLKADTIVIATGAKPNNELLTKLEGKVTEMYSIGDCVEARRIINAIAEGTSAGSRI